MKRKNKVIERIKVLKLPRNIWNRLFAVFLVFSGILLALIALNSLGKKVSGLRADDMFKDNAVIIETPNIIDVSSPEFIGTENCQNCVSLTLEVQHFSPLERRLDGVVHIYIPNSVMERLWSNYEYVATPDNDYPSRLILKDEYKDSEISLINFSSFLSNSKFETKIPLGRFFENFAENTVSVPVSINFSGESVSYPGDWYYASDYFSLQLPNELSLRTGTGFGGTLPIEMFVSSNFQFGDFIIKIKRDSTENSTIYHSLEMLIVRASSTKYYIYAMAMLPILLSLVFAHSNFTKRKNNEQITASLFLEVSAILFSVLPLRSVLVPSYFDSLVSVDLILGLGIALIMLIAFIVYAQEVWKIK